MILLLGGMMKVLLVTSILGREVVEGNSLGNDVYVMPIQVAAFINAKSVALNLLENDLDLSGYDMVLLPGRSRGDAEIIEKKTGIPAYKGPIHAQNLTYYLENLESVELSTKEPANNLINQEKQKNPGHEEDPQFMIEDVGIGDYPRIIAEIQNVGNIEMDEIKEKTHYFIRSGADIIDLGIERETEPEVIIDKIEELKKDDKVQEYSIPISIDSMNPDMINRGVKAGADLVLSIDEGNIKECITETPIVLIPTNQKKGEYNREPEKRIETLLNLKKEAYDLGYEKLILDPLLEPYPNLVKSIRSYNLLKEEGLEEPTMAGIGNVTEMIDADSVGINSLLAGIGKELDIDLFLQVEASRKTLGSIKELKTAIKMFEESEHLPKNLRQNLLILKEKNYKGIKYNAEENTEVIKPQKQPEKEMDDIYFRIYLENNEINVIGYKGKKQKFLIKGKNPESILNEITKKAEISRTHSFYLGRELEKAKICSKLNKSYRQEEEIFDEFYKKQKRS